MGSVYGYEIRSEIAMSRLRPAAGSRGVIEVRAGDESMLDAEGVITALQPGDPALGAALLAIATVEGGHLIVCEITGGYLLEPDELRITVARKGADEAWEHRLLSVIIPLLLSARGDLALHGAVVEADGAALVLCGPTMRGKSTLAKAFSDLGRRVLSEDGAVLEPVEGEFLAWPGASGVRIREMTEGRLTRRIQPLGADATALPPEAVVLLEERGPELVVERLTPADGLLRLGPQMLQMGGREALGAAFAALAGLLGGVPAYAASLPDDLMALPDAAADLAAAVMAGASEWAR